MDPQVIECPVDEWTLVAESMLIGRVHVVDTKAQYYYTYRESGNDAPDDGGVEGIPFGPGRPLEFPDLRGIDVYVFCKDKAGKVRVDKPQQQLAFLDGALNIHDADVHTEAFLHFVDEANGAETTLATSVLKNAYILPVLSVTGFSVGGYVNLHFGLAHIHKYFQVTAIDGLNLVLDTRLDFDFPAGSLVVATNFSFNVLGTMAAPRIFSAPLAEGEILHITALHVAFIHKAAADDEKFAGIAALDNGIVARVGRNNGESYETIFNWKNNREMKLDAGAADVIYADASPAGNYGTSVSFNGTHITGSVLRLDGSNFDTLELLIQDDLTDTDLVDAKAKFMGHYEGVSI